MVAATEMPVRRATVGAALRRRRGPSPAPRLWAIGGGKGGVGKSVVASGLAVTFADLGRRCVLVDADLGGANLHTLLGVESLRQTLFHFLNGEVARLSEVASPTSVANLTLISGADSVLDAANPRYSRKQKFLRHLRNLDADDVILDLGAGSAFNTLDFFLAADHGIVVIDPEPTSVDNAYHFLKAAFLRSLRSVARTSSIRSAIEQVMAERGNRHALSPRDLIDGVTRFDPSAGLELEECVERFAPILIVNQAKTPADRELGWEIRSSARNFLGARVEFLGALDWDESVKQAVRQRRPVRQLYPSCPFSRDLRAVTDRLLHPDMPSPPRAGRGSVVSIARTRADGAPLPPLDLSEPGAYLRRAREHLGLTLSQLRTYTRIRCLELIECQRFALLPPEPYARGFILLYARTLGIREAEDLATSYMDHYRRDRKALLL